MLTMTLDQEAEVRLTITDRVGNPAQVQGAPSWEVSLEDLVDVVEADDGMSAVIRSRDMTGETSVAVVVDADLGEGVREIRGVLAVSVTAGDATVIELQADAPRPKAAG